MAVLDAIRERRPPFSPEDVVREFAALLKSYRITEVQGDRYAGEWPCERFREHGFTYETAAKPKSDLYRDYCPQSIREWSICSKTRDCLRRSLALSAVLHAVAATASTTHRAHTMILPMPSRVSSRRSPLLIPTTRR